MRKKLMPRRKDRRVFRRLFDKTKKINTITMMRGGIRL